MGMEREYIPSVVLSGSKEVRYDFFRQRFVEHPVIEDVQNRVMRTLRYRGDQSIVIVFGPAGAGKSTLRAYLTETIDREMPPDPNVNPSHISVVGIDLDSPDQGAFDWTAHYYTPALKALHAVQIKNKISVQIEHLYTTASGQVVVRRDVKRPELRESLKTALSLRCPPAFTVDDAQHLTKVRKGSKLLDQIDSIKSLADATKVPHILFGTYSTLLLVALSPELMRRTVHTHLRRYHAENTEDWEAFKDVLYALQQYIPIPNEPDLLSHADYFWEQSRGCIGILKERLNRALQNALDQESTTLGPVHWEPIELQDWEMAAMEEHIQQGELSYKTKTKEEILQREPAATSGKTSKKKTAVGIPAPNRNKVGLE